METLVLATPVAPPPSGPTITGYTIAAISLDWANHVLLITVQDNTGATKSFSYTGNQADPLLHAVNTGNFTNGSLQADALNYLVSDGHLPAGTVSGTPV